MFTPAGSYASYGVDSDFPLPPPEVLPPPPPPVPSHPITNALDKNYPPSQPIASVGARGGDSNQPMTSELRNHAANSEARGYYAPPPVGSPVSSTYSELRRVTPPHNYPPPPGPFQNTTLPQTVSNFFLKLGMYFCYALNIFFF